MVQDGTGRCEAVSDVLVEECGRSVESIAKFGDLGASGVGWDVGCRSGVDGPEKSGDR